MHLQPCKAWKSTIVIILVCGCIITADLFWYAIEKEEYHKIKILTKTTAATLGSNHHSTDKTNPEVKSTTTLPSVHKTMKISTEPPLILLSYGYIEPTFNPKKITTVLGRECVTTTNVLQMDASDAVVVRFSQAFEANTITKPTTRRPEQFFVYLSLEAPWSFHDLNYNFVDKDYFNWTMTYRRDSDVFFPYYSMDRLMSGQEDRKVVDLYYGEKVVKKIIAGKTSDFTALTAVSNCGERDGTRHRMKYISELEDNGLRIEKRGGCFGKRYPSPWYSENFSSYCGTFKFFLAFENAYHCRDYVTEKTWFNSLRSGAVPVILGAPKSDVVKLIPAGSYIHADDFDGPKELAIFLNYLDSNVTAYAEYFKWRRIAPPEDVLKPRDYGYSLLCHKLWENRIYGNGSKVYHSFKDWYLGQDNPECFKLENLD